MRTITILNELAEKLNETVRISANDVPHIVINRPDKTYSVCYFGSTNTFRIFCPYPSSKQTKITVNTQKEVLKFFE